MSGQPVDVGKSTAMALVADHYGEITIAPFEFSLTEIGFERVSAAISHAQHERVALVTRIGVDAAGPLPPHPDRAAASSWPGGRRTQTRARSKMHADNSYCAR